METKAKLVDNMQFVAWSGSGHAIVMDASDKTGGENTGSRPMEVLLMGLLGCTGMDVISILRKMRVKIDRFELGVDTERAKMHPMVYTKIHIIYSFWGKDINEAKVEKAIELSQNTYCSASAMFKKTAEVSYEYKIFKD